MNDAVDGATPLALARAVAQGAIKVVDLTQTLTPDFPTLVLPPGFAPCAPFRRDVISRYDAPGPMWYWGNFSMNEHTGTHFDAPVHWVTGKDLPRNTTETMPPEDFVAPACVVDCSAQAAADPDFVLDVATLMAWEAEHGEILRRGWLLFRTDWSKRRGAEFANLRQDGAHTPGPSPEAVRWLLAERDVHGFGVETIGTDAGQAHAFDPPYPAHHFMHGAGRYGLQCLTNLDQLPPKGAVVVAAPLKIEDGSGSPLRVLALVPSAGPPPARPA